MQLRALLHADTAENILCSLLLLPACSYKCLLISGWSPDLIAPVPVMQRSEMVRSSSRRRAAAPVSETLGKLGVDSGEDLQVRTTSYVPFHVFYPAL